MKACDFSFQKRVTRDAGELAASLSAWQQSYEQISAGPFEARLELLQVGAVQVFRERSNRTVFQHGAARAATVTLGVTQSRTVRGWYSGHRLEGEKLIALAARDEFELVAGDDMDLIAVCIDVEQLAELGSQVRGPGFQFSLPAPSVLGDGPAGHGELKGLLDSAMLLASERPDLLDHAAARRMLAYSLSDAVLECLAPAHRVTELAPSAGARRRIVATAREYMRNHTEDAIAVPELCAVTCTSRRTLQYAFEDILNVSPLAYLRAMRLNGVRRELSLHRDQTVGDVAARWGFWHLSRFAADYRTMFGELPSATRSRMLAS